MSKFSPIALFVFNRPEHTKNTLNALKENPEFAQSHLYVFCDGPRHEQDAMQVQAVRDVVKAFAFPNVTIVERVHNMGLANSVITGVTELCNQFGRVIVLEDDLVVSRYFLGYMNSALARYEHEDRVMQVSGYMFPIQWNIQKDTSDTFFMPVTTSWGWATWQRAWLKFDAEANGYQTLCQNKKLKKEFNLDGAYPYFSMLEKQRKGLVDSWAIRWYLSVLLAKGLVLFPRRSLVSNAGFDGSGVHCHDAKIKAETQFASFSPTCFPGSISVDATFPDYVEYVKKENSVFQRLVNRLGFKE